MEQALKIEERDIVSFLNSGERAIVRSAYSGLYVRGEQNDFVYLDENGCDKYSGVKVVELAEKYHPSISFNGAEVRLLNVVFDGSDRLVYAEMVGADPYIRAVTAVLMQGKRSQSDHWVHTDVRDNWKVLPKGYQRIAEPLKLGMTHATLIHSASCTPKGSLRILIGNSDEQILARFKQWLNSQPLPRLADYARELGIERDLEAELFRGLKIGGRLIQLRPLKGLAYEVSEELKQDDFKELRNALVEVANGCKKQPANKPQEALKKEIADRSYGEALNSRIFVGSIPAAA